MSFVSSVARMNKRRGLCHPFQCLHLKYHLKSCINPFTPSSRGKAGTFENNTGLTQNLHLPGDRGVIIFSGACVFLLPEATSAAAYQATTKMDHTCFLASSITGIWQNSHTHTHFPATFFSFIGNLSYGQYVRVRFKNPSCIQLMMPLKWEKEEAGQGHKENTRILCMLFSWTARKNVLICWHWERKEWRWRWAYPHL